MNNLFKEREERTKKRKKAKEMFDKNITLALPANDGMKCTLALERSEGKSRLLDEGAIVTANGDLDLYITKGTIRKFVNGKNKKLTPRSVYGEFAGEYFKSPDEPMNIDEKYEGTINVGHNDFSTFPFIVGSWSREDLSVANNENGRKGLDIDVKLNEAHPFVQAFRVQGIPLGVSVEMFIHVDESATEEVRETYKEMTGKDYSYALAVDEIFISDFAIVGECGNVGSSDSIDLKGEIMDKEKITLDVETTDVDEETLTNDIDVDEAAEATVEADDVTAIDESVIDGEETESEEAEDGDEAEGDETDDRALSLIAEMQEALERSNETIKSLQAQVDELKKAGKKKSKKLKAQNDKIEEFGKKFKGLSVDLGLIDEEPEDSEGEVIAERYPGGDVIGG